MRQNSLTNLGLAFLRISSSLLLLTHGYPKLQKLIKGDIKFADPLGIGEAPTLFLAVLAEFLCPLLIIIGYKTRWASIPIVITMLVAILKVHAADPIATKEMALLYLIIFVAVALIGPGKYSVDRK